MIRLNGQQINPTIFPDKTSQVWHIPDFYVKQTTNHIKWYFESEDEFFHIAQLVFLVRNIKSVSEIQLEIPYLPYARQDKDISNNNSFALCVFLRLLNILPIDKLILRDPHNKNFIEESDYTKEVCLIEDTAYQKSLIKFVKENNIQQILFPDAGAKNRYSKIQFENCLCFYGNKTRDALTGQIIGLSLSDTPHNIRTIVIDDICDGGATFIELAKHTQPYISMENMYLYVTHGIFSKGLSELLKHYTRIITTDSRLNVFSYGNLLTIL